MSVKSITSAAEFSALISQEKLTVVDFYATWCGPCKAIKPAKHTCSSIAYVRNVNFAQVDVDQVSDVAKAAGISAMPTFQFYVKGKRVDELKGANPQGLKDLIEKHMTDAPSSTPEKSGAPSGFVDLTSLINMKQVDCLNQQAAHGVQNIFKKDPSSLLSDVDEQLIINIPFNQNVKIHSIKITAPAGISYYPLILSDKGPQKLKTFVNRPTTVSFDEVDSIPATEEISLSPEDVSGEKVIHLRYVKYQNVNSIQIFVESNFAGDDVSAIERLVLYGLPIETTNMKEFKKVGGDH